MASPTSSQQTTLQYVPDTSFCCIKITALKENIFEIKRYFANSFSLT